MEVKNTEKKTKTVTGQSAIVMGALTVGVGLLSCVLFRHTQTCLGLFLAVVVANAVLHLICFRANNEGSPTMGLIIITTAEICTVVLSLLSFFMLGSEGSVLVIAVLCAFYLIMNGAALIAIPSTLSHRFGYSSIGTGVLLFVSGIGLPGLLGLVAGIGLAVNGAERLFMSLQSRR